MLLRLWGLPAHQGDLVQQAMGQMCFSQARTYHLCCRMYLTAWSTPAVKASCLQKLFWRTLPCSGPSA